MKNTELNNQKSVLPKADEGRIVSKNIKFSDINGGVSPDISYTVLMVNLIQNEYVSQIFIEPIISFHDTGANDDLSLSINEQISAEIYAIVPLNTTTVYVNGNVVNYAQNARTFVYNSADIHNSSIRPINLDFTGTDLTLLDTGEVNIYFKVETLLEP